MPTTYTGNSAMIDLWHRNSIIYALHVEAYQDSDGDGFGDFRGLTDRLDYIENLGVDCIWLLPFYPSPFRDFGYDVSDYYHVASRYGTPGDFVEFTHQAGERGMRVIADLVVNHTSDQHPWFQTARKDPRSRFRDFYVWSESEPEHKDGAVFPGVQDTTWTYDETAGAWYFHRFYRHEPDLNIANPAVREEICRIMGFWLQLGVSGFRVDAAPFVVEMRGIEDAGIEDPYEYFREFRRFLSWRQGDAILVAEANVSDDKVPLYFGNEDRMHMLFDFLVNQRLFLALARQQAAPLIDALKNLPQVPLIGQWLNFLRTHDELDLGRLSERERREAFEAFGPDEDMQIYGRGIRRRLAPMLAGDRRRLELAYSLMFSLPGTPMLLYGEEIGMGDDLSLPERNSIRTPMQWSDEPNGGFSTADPDRLVRPAISGGEYGYERVNVAAQHRSSDSLLAWMTHLIAVRKECPEIGWGDCRILETGHPGVAAWLCQWKGGSVVTVHNLADETARVRLKLDGLPADEMIELLGDRRHDRVGTGEEIELDAYGYRWFRVGHPRRTPV